MLRAEEAARLSEATQAAYAEAERGGSDWLHVTEALQRRLLREEAGVPPERTAAALFALRAAAQLFPRDAELRSIPLYVRHNRAAQGGLREGDAVPDVPLHTLRSGGAALAQAAVHGTVAGTVSLRAACAGPLPTLLVAGSWT